MHTFTLFGSVRRFTLVAAVPLSAAWLGCLGQDLAPTPAPAPLTNQAAVVTGERSAPCFPNKTCNGELVCEDGTCVGKKIGTPDAPSTTDGGAATDAQAADANVDADAQCKKSGVSFSPSFIAEPAPKKLACTEAQIATLAQYCFKTPESPGCAVTRGQYAACADCAFGTTNDAQWKPIVFTGGAPAFFYNVAACVDRESGVPDCGKKYTRVAACFDTYCDACTTYATETACQKGVAADECKSYLLDATCGNALNGPSEKCFPIDATDSALMKQFINLVTLACG